MVFISLHVVGVCLFVCVCSCELWVEAMWSCYKTDTTMNCYWYFFLPCSFCFIFFLHSSFTSQFHSIWIDFCYSTAPRIRMTICDVAYQHLTKHSQLLHCTKNSTKYEGLFLLESSWCCRSNEIATRQKVVVKRDSKRIKRRNCVTPPGKEKKDSTNFSRFQWFL